MPNRRSPRRHADSAFGQRPATLADGSLGEKLPATAAVVQAVEQWQVTKAGKPRIARLARLAKSKDKALAQAATTRRGTRSGPFSRRITSAGDRGTVTDESR